MKAASRLESRALLASVRPSEDVGEWLYSDYLSSESHVVQLKGKGGSESTYPPQDTCLLSRPQPHSRRPVAEPGCF